MRILSGIQPSGTLHIGNYFGMMKPAIELQEKGEVFYFIADYHAQTTMDDPKDLNPRSLNVIRDFVACGLDPDRAVLYQQSAVPEIHELAWYLSIVTPMGLLERCHSYKDKTARGIVASHALFAYPVLMAADILMYDADVVPVGQDQKQHLEVTRDIAQKFNDRFGEIFRIPEAKIQESTAVIMGIDGQKMSKSYNNTIEIFAPEKEFRKKIMSIKTDSTPVEAPKSIKNSVLIGVAHGTASPVVFDSIKKKMEQGGVGYGELKQEYFEDLWKYFEPFRAKRETLTDDVVRGIISKGNTRVREMAKQKLAQVRKAVGIIN
jgi:tryptophanyl-tRNA synthetase